MPHEATVDHTDVLNDEEFVGAQMRAKEALSKNVINTDNINKQITNICPPTLEKGNRNFDDDTSSDEGTSDQLLLVNGEQHKINGAF